MMPFSLIEAANSSREPSPKFLRGLRGLERRNSIGIFCWLRDRVAAASVSAPPRRAARPRPSRGASSADLLGFITGSSNKNSSMDTNDIYAIYIEYRTLKPPRLGGAALALDHFRR